MKKQLLKNALSKTTMYTYKVSMKYRGVLLLIYTMFIYMVFSGKASAAGASGDIFVQATNLVNDVKGKLIGMSSAAAAVGVGTGTFMKKFSMGKQDKIELGNKVIKDSIIGWFTLNSITYILGFLGKYTSEGGGQ